MELAQTMMKEVWLREARRNLIERRRLAEARAERWRGLLHMARSTGRTSRVSRIEARVMHAELELKNITWALGKVRRGEVY